MTKTSWKTEWNLKLLYKSPKDPQIEKDILAAEHACIAFEKKYRGKKGWLKNDATLLAALKDYEKLADRTEDSKPLMYFSYRKELNSTDNYAEAQIRLIGERMTKAHNRIQFFELAMGKIPVAQQKKLLASSNLARYRYFLQRIFDTAKYDLSEPEEKIMALKSAPASGMWSSGLESALNKLTIQWKGADVAVNKALEMVSEEKNVKSREKLWSLVLGALATINDFAESEINAVFTNKKINDELRGFKEPYDATILGYENDAKSVLAMAEAVTKRYDISHRFYTLKKKMLGLPKLEYQDRGASVGTTKGKYSFDDSMRMVGDAFETLDQKYRDILERFAKNGQVDVYPKTGKGGGAFCSHAHGLPTFIMLNHVDTMRSLSTLAHEVGHGIHSELSAAAQPVIYEGYSTAVAETASTFFEGVVFSRVAEQLNENERMIALHDRIQDAISTIFRQIAFFNFELELHRAVRERGWVPKEDIATMLQKHLQAQLGKAVSVNERDGLSYIYIGHFRRPFYVYSYAYGELISSALRARVKEDPSYIKKVDEFLSAGRSKAPEQIFADIGITVGPKLFAEGLQAIDDDITELENLVHAKSRKRSGKKR